MWRYGRQLLGSHPIDAIEQGLRFIPQNWGKVESRADHDALLGLRAAKRPKKEFASRKRSIRLWMGQNSWKENAPWLDRLRVCGMLLSRPTRRRGQGRKGQGFTSSLKSKQLGIARECAAATIRPIHSRKADSGGWKDHSCRVLIDPRLVHWTKSAVNRDSQLCHTLISCGKHGSASPADRERRSQSQFIRRKASDGSPVARPAKTTCEESNISSQDQHGHSVE